MNRTKFDPEISTNENLLAMGFTSRPAACRRLGLGLNYNRRGVKVITSSLGVDVFVGDCFEVNEFLKGWS